MKWLPLAWISALVLGGGCGAASARHAAALEDARAERDRARAEQERSEARAGRLADRVRELEAELALARAEVRDLRAESRPPLRETVTLGSDGEREAGRGAELPWDEPVRQERDRSRPALRLYGHGDRADAEALAPVPEVPEEMRLSVAPVPESSSHGFARGDETDEPRDTHGEDGPGAVEQYRAALALVRNRQFELALEAFGAFLARHPDHAYADNAVYWQGEVLYALQRYEDAVRSFARVVQRYPRGNKAPDALLKMALCHQRMDDPGAAREALYRLQREYPDSMAARVASRENAT